MCAHWKSTATTCQISVITMLSVHRRQTDGNVFAIKVSFGEKFISQNFRFEATHKSKKMEPTKALQIFRATNINRQKYPCKPCAPCPKKPIVWRTLKFCNKVFVAGSLIYYTGKHGAWGSQDQSAQFMRDLNIHLRNLMPLYIVSIIWGDK